jgi:hypothetical protein
MYSLRNDDADFDNKINNSIRNDLVSLGKTQHQDRLTRAIHGMFPILERRRGHDKEGSMSISDYRLGIIVGAVNVVVVAGLLFGAVFDLYRIQNWRRGWGCSPRIPLSSRLP